MSTDMKQDNIMNVDTVALDDARGALVIIDQTRLPGEVHILSLTDQKDIWDAIYLLKVRGMSMRDAGILDGDTVVIQKQPMVRADEIAAVLWNGEATLKYVRHSRGHVLLVPANDAMEPMVVDAARTLEFSILGKVVAVVRNKL